MIQSPTAREILQDLLVNSANICELHTKGDIGDFPVIEHYSHITCSKEPDSLYQPLQKRLQQPDDYPHLGISVFSKDGAIRLVNFFSALEIRTLAYQAASGEWKVAVPEIYLQSSLPVPYNAVLNGMLFLSGAPERLLSFIQTARVLRNGLNALKAAGVITTFMMRNTQREFALLVSTDAAVIEAIQMALPADYRSEADMLDGIVRLGASAAVVPEVTEAVQNAFQRLLHAQAAPRRTDPPEDARASAAP